MTEHHKEVETKPEPASRLETRNDVSRPAPGGLTAKVWETADHLSQHHSRPATRAEVGAALPDMSPGTISTQYARWRKFYGIPAVGRATNAEAKAAKAAEREAAKAEREKAKAEKAAEREAAKRAKAAAKKAGADTSVA